MGDSNCNYGVLKFDPNDDPFKSIAEKSFSKFEGQKSTFDFKNFSLYSDKNEKKLIEQAKIYTEEIFPNIVGKVMMVKFNN